MMLKRYFDKSQTVSDCRNYFNTYTQYPLLDDGNIECTPKRLGIIHQLNDMLHSVEECERLGLLSHRSVIRLCNVAANIRYNKSAKFWETATDKPFSKLVGDMLELRYTKKRKSI